MTSLSGGKFEQGLLSGALGSLVATGAGKMFTGTGNWGQATGAVIGGSLSGGIGATIAGGNFWDGFRNGAISAGLNHMMHLMTDPEDPPVSNPKNQQQKDTPWMKTALEEYNAGIKEVPSGSNSGPRVDEYLSYAGVSSPNQWCGAFVNWCLGQNGIAGAGALGSNYLNWGIQLENPIYGAIAIFKTGHVGFYMGTNSDGTLKILHGNWSNRVKISSGVYDPIYPNQIKQYRFPQL